MIEIEILMAYGLLLVNKGLCVIARMGGNSLVADLAGWPFSYRRVLAMYLAFLG